MCHGRSRDSLFLRQVLTTYEVANETTEDALHQKFRALLRPRMLHALRLSLSRYSPSLPYHEAAAPRSWSHGARPRSTASDSAPSSPADALAWTGLRGCVPAAVRSAIASAPAPLGRPPPHLRSGQPAADCMGYHLAVATGCRPAPPFTRSPGLMRHAARCAPGDRTLLPWPRCYRPLPHPGACAQ